LGDNAAAEDATQETFIRVFRHLQKTPDSREALTWIYRIATNYCLNEIRNQKLRPTPMPVLPDVPDWTEDRYVLRDLVNGLLDHVPEKLRAPAFLHYIDGLDQSEVARILGISRRTVLYRLAEFARIGRTFLKKV